MSAVAQILLSMNRARENGRKVEHIRNSVLAESARAMLSLRAAAEPVPDELWATLERGLSVYDASHQIVMDPEDFLDE